MWVFTPLLSLVACPTLLQFSSLHNPPFSPHFWFCCKYAFLRMQTFMAMWSSTLGPLIQMEGYPYLATNIMKIWLPFACLQRFHSIAKEALYYPTKKPTFNYFSIYDLLGYGGVGWGSLNKNFFACSILKRFF
jgi:hypothetical protein